MRSGNMSTEARDMAVESLRARISVFDDAIDIKNGVDSEFSSAAESLADDADSAEQLRRIRDLLIEAADALDAGG